MTLTELLRIGDEVTFKVDPETRNHTDTYKHVPDGTKGVVCGFYDAVIYEPRVPVLVHQPGVYHTKGSVSVWLADGRIIRGDYAVEMVDKDEEARRDIAMRDERGILIRARVRLGDLPETKFWEQDKVRVRFPHDDSVREMTIAIINYHNLHERRTDDSPMPLYEVAYLDGGTTFADEAQIELIERGNVWKHYHSEPLVFADLKEEAAFFTLIGETAEVANPTTGLFSWTKDEILSAVKNGTVHGFTTSRMPFSTSVFINARRFKDAALGKRVAQATLEGFGLEATAASL